ncbi:GNAT family N-acetyltransferase [Acinetobacter colistiniresistens]|uniref:GNAT family N-acetyltransferase n=1 Tax=Acinetobacter colistiniresistens TaxID=280145 RepID=UPI00211CA09D|nr:GNAT family N-acetyltransferase [Acinetobacter colistiniresistens]UUM29361.1 GNAT family N-acetyltransferase [Acinetobacter colistiniresistens]
MNIIKLVNTPELLAQAAMWFSDKWEIPIEAYRDSIQISIEQPGEIPQWYLILNKHQQIIAGAGVIENDFHDRNDLSPNLCALFVEEAYRKQNIARELLDFIRAEMKNLGFEKLYLVTDLDDFYEKCGWVFLTRVQDDEGELMKMYVADTF